MKDKVEYKRMTELLSFRVTDDLPERWHDLDYDESENVPKRGTNQLKLLISLIVTSNFTKI